MIQKLESDVRGHIKVRDLLRLTKNLAWTRDENSYGLFRRKDRVTTGTRRWWHWWLTRTTSKTVRDISGQNQAIKRSKGERSERGYQKTWGAKQQKWITP